MIRKTHTTIATLVATFVVAAAAAGPAQAQPNTGDPIHDGYCAALEDQAREYSYRAATAQSAMTARYWDNRWEAVLAKARKERCEWVAALPARPVMTPGKLSSTDTAPAHPVRVVPGGGILDTATTSG